MDLLAGQRTHEAHGKKEKTNGDVENKGQQTEQALKNTHVRNPV
jgi:hypothetical protein